jgi:hypothetical protein
MTDRTTLEAAIGQFIATHEERTAGQTYALRDLARRLEAADQAATDHLRLIIAEHETRRASLADLLEAFRTSVCSLPPPPPTRPAVTAPRPHQAQDNAPAPYNPIARRAV